MLDVCMIMHNFEGLKREYFFPLYVRLFGCSDVRMFGCSDVRMFGCSDVRMFGCSDVRMFGCSVVRMFGCSVVRLFGCSDVRLFGCSVVRLFGCSDFGCSVVRLFGCSDVRLFGCSGVRVCVTCSLALGSCYESTFFSQRVVDRWKRLPTATVCADTISWFKTRYTQCYGNTGALYKPT